MTVYRPFNSERPPVRGPIYDSMTAAALWCLGQPKENYTKWEIEMLRSEELDGSILTTSDSCRDPSA